MLALMSTRLAQMFGATDVSSDGPGGISWQLQASCRESSRQESYWRSHKLMIIVMDQEEVHGICKLQAEDHLGHCDFSCLDSQGTKQWQRVQSHLRGSRWAQSLHQALSIGECARRAFQQYAEVQIWIPGSKVISYR